ncbi:MAG TPA: chemotaxis protein [Gammaproteobacteria bacterium]|nr:chemotaxis protein [Gammaproteobacteria bacterium]
MQDQLLSSGIDKQALGRIENLLKQTMGLHSASIGSSSIVRAIQRRMSACAQVDGVCGVDAYLARIFTSAEELNALVEEVVIPETWFFRDRKAFDALQQFVSREWAPAHTRGQLRVLSLPCSTGEEAYSIVMTLMKAGLTAEQFHIDALDISLQALARARLAIYGENAFRGNELAFRERFFRATDAGYILDKKIRQSVNFIQANMLDAAFMPGQGLYDVIFCRNVMIYFDSVTQTRAVGVLSRLLKAEGILFVGHAESSMILNHSYVSQHLPRAFAFRKAGSRQSSRPDHRPGFEMQACVHHQLEDTKKIRPFPEAPPAYHKANQSAESLEQAFHLANEGRLAEAAELCESWLQRNEPCVRAYYLLGLIREAAGSGQQAEECLRKAVYLQPDHQEALVHLALLMEQSGDTAAAEVLHQRARRAAKQQAATRHIPARAHR